MSSISESSRKHPRVHGEDACLHRWRVLEPEASSRTWRRLEDRAYVGCDTGSILAYMEKTSSCFASMISVKKHPRVHGEDCSCIGDGPSRSEASSRTWRRQRRLRGTTSHRRSILAYMEKTRCRHLHCWTHSKHPRVHGEDTSAPIGIPKETRWFFFISI